MYELIVTNLNQHIEISNYKYMKKKLNEKPCSKINGEIDGRVTLFDQYDVHDL